MAQFLIVVLIIAAANAVLGGALGLRTPGVDASTPEDDAPAEQGEDAGESDASTTESMEPPPPLDVPRYVADVLQANSAA